MAGPYDAKGGLLTLALDLGRRLLPALQTDSGIPFGSINLRRGVASTETPVTCTAAAGTLLLEFGLLSRLSGDPAFEAAAHAAHVKGSSSPGISASDVHARCTSPSQTSQRSTSCMGVSSASSVDFWQMTHSSSNGTTSKGAPLSSAARASNSSRTARFGRSRTGLTGLSSINFPICSASKP